ncbi:MAG: thioredoxin-disulfide reductase [Desulfovibrio sp.]
MKEYDAVVVGGGPAGATAALYLVRSGVNVAMVEKLSGGGQMLKTDEIENYPGFPDGIRGWELADKFTAHLDHYEFDKFMDEVREIKLGKHHEMLIGDEWIRTKTIILCTGAEYRKLGVPGESRLTGRGVSYCALCDGNFYRDRDVVVVGGGNSALEESLYLARLVNKIHLVHRRDDFRGLQCYQDKCFINPKINVIRSSVVTEIVGENEVTGVEIENLNTGEKSVIEADGAFVFVGFVPVMEYVPEEVERDRNGLKVDLEMATSVPGVFAAGDIISKSCRQVATAVGDGATAATSAFAYLEQMDA